MYLVIGGAGYLGTNLIQAILAKTDDKIIATARSVPPLPATSRVIWEVCDISSRESIDRLAEKISGYFLRVIVCAALHHPDKVQKEPKKAWDINITALSYLLNRLENVTCLYYPSTDSVYGEGDGSYRFREEDAVNPVNIYGRQKAVAEQLVIGYGYNVVRFPFLIGPSMVPNKPHFYDRIVQTICGGHSMEMFQDSYRSTLDFGSAASYTVDLMELNHAVPQILNICGDSSLSKYDVGLLIARKFNVPEKLIVPISVQNGQDIFETARAQTTLMDNRKLKEVLRLERIELCL